MKMLVVLACLTAVALATPAAITPEIQARRMLPALKHEEIHDEFGQYAFRYVTAEGTIVQERGQLVPTADGRSMVMAVEGETSYIGEDGKTYVNKYRSGFDGSHELKMENTHFPTPMLIPGMPAVSIV